MKLYRIVFPMLAAIALLLGCKEEEDIALPVLNVSPTELAFQQTGGNLTFSVNANRAWTVETEAGWLAVTPTSGSASGTAATVTVTALANESNDRTAEIKVKTEFDYRTIAVSQPGAKGEDTTDKPSGDGTKASPFNPAGAVEYVKSLGPDVESPDVVYITGIISEVSTTFEASGKFGNANFYISEDGSKDLVQFYVFQTYYLGNKMWTAGNTDIKVGDEVTICGKVVNFKGNTPETVKQGGSYIYTLNGKTEEGGSTQPSDYENAPAKSVSDFIKAADKNNYYKLTGTVSGFNAKFCSFDLTDDSGSIYVYSVKNKDEWSSKISNGGTVTLSGKYDFYTEKQQHEVIDAYILSFDDTPVEAQDATVAQALEAAKDARLNVGPALVVASASAGCLIKQDDAMIYVYGATSAVGDMVKVEATRGEYGGVAQLTDPTVTVVSSGNAVSHPEPRDITSSFGSYSSDSREYISFKGTLNISGNYYNITVAGSDNVTGSIVKPTQDLSALNGKEVTVKGYFLYFASQGKYLYVIATEITDGEGGSVDPTDPPAEATDATVAQALDAAQGAHLNVGPALVVAAAKTGFLISQDDAMIYVHGGTAKEGDMVTVVSTRGEYGGVPQLTDPTVTVVSSDNAVSRPEPKDITSSFASYSADSREYVTFKGKLSISGNYYNVAVEGTEDVIGSLVAPVADISSLNGHNITVKGYFLYFTSQGKYLNVIATQIDDDGVVLSNGFTVTDDGESVDFSKFGYENGVPYLEAKGTHITVNFEGGGNNGKYYTTGNGMRIYGDGTVKVSAAEGKVITKIVYTFANGYAPDDKATVSAGSYDVESATWTGSAASVSLSRPSGSGHWRLQKMAVTLEAAGGE